MADRVCDFCDVAEGDGVNVNDCDSCGALCCTVHSVDGEGQTVLCEKCAPEVED